MENNWEEIDDDVFNEAWAFGADDVQKKANVKHQMQILLAKKEKELKSEYEGKITEALREVKGKIEEVLSGIYLDVASDPEEGDPPLESYENGAIETLESVKEKVIKAIEALNTPKE